MKDVIEFRKSRLPAIIVALSFLIVAASPVSAAEPEGAALYRSRCGGCHGPEGEGGSALPLNKEGLLVTVSVDYFIASIRYGRPLSGCPSFEKELSDAEREAIARHVKSWQRGPLLEAPAHTVAPAETREGKEGFALCAGCHGFKGEGAMGPPLFDMGLLKSISDQDLRRTIYYGRPGTPMRGFLKGFEGNLGAMDATRIDQVLAYIRFRQQGIEAETGSRMRP